MTTDTTWTDYFLKVYETDSGWLDYSNPRVQAQTFGVAIEAAGPIGGKRCLDVGCGRGQIARAMAGFNAREVVGVDMIDESIVALRQTDPHIRWEAGRADDELFCRSLGGFDVIFAIEILQFVDMRKTLHILWNCLNPGGRIIAIVPNKDNPIVQKTNARFGGVYWATNPTELASIVAELSDLECWSYRGMDFQQDQRIVPYMLSPWIDSPKPELTSNRLVNAIQKRGAKVDM